MPVRSSVCTYSPAAASAKYSATCLPAAHYKPLASARPTSYGSTVTYGATNYGTTSSTGTTKSLASLTSRYNQSSYSPTSSLASYSSLGSTHSSSSSSYSPSSTTTSCSSSSSGLYRPLSSSAQSSFSGRATPHQPSTSYNRYSTASNSSASSLASLSTSTTGYSSSASYNRNHNHNQSYLQHQPSASLSSTLGRRGLSSGYQSSSASSETLLASGVPRGLVNLGNTCYMNAVLQSLYSLEPFRQLVMRQYGSDKPLTMELADLFRAMKSSTSAPVSPSNFKLAFARHQAKFSGLSQQDAQEFLRYLINGLHEEMNQAARRPRRSAPPRAPSSAQEAWQQYRDIVDDSPLVDLLVGQMCSTIVCSVCQNKSHCWDPFWDLSLPLARTRHSAIRLAEVLQDFSAKETLDGDERPICSSCKRVTRSTKQIELSRLPPLLILHLKKFTNDGYKLTSPEVRTDQQLNLGQLQAPPSSSPSSTYQLAASISHHGHSASSGHYTSHSRYSSSWFHFNDDRVKDVTSSFDSAKLNDAYVLFYTQSSPNQSKL